MTTYVVLWYNGGSPHAPNRCIGRTKLDADNTQQAINYACAMMMNPELIDDPETRSTVEMARGFYIKDSKER